MILNGREDEHDAMLLISFAKLLVTKHFKVLPLKLMDQRHCSGLFDHPEVNEHFKRFCSKLANMITQLDKNTVEALNRKVAISKSQIFINFLDVNVNKAVYECLFIVGSWCKNGILINVLDLMHYSGIAFSEPLDLSNPRYCGKYKPEDVQLLKLHPAYHYFVEIIEATFASQRNREGALLVATHTDEFEDEHTCEERLHKMKVMIDGYSQEVGISEVISPNFIKVSNIRRSDGYKRIKKKLISLIGSRFGENNYVMLKFMFFHSFLQSTNKMFLTQDKVREYGYGCGLDDKEIEQCLQLFHHSCFIFRIKDYVILSLTEFIEGLNKLYYIRNDENAPKGEVVPIEYGFLSYKLCRYIWGDNGGGLCALYSSILGNVGLLVELKSKEVPDFSPVYFMPSLRMEYEEAEVSNESTSLIIDYNVSLIPFHKQCAFVKYFQSHPHMETVKVLDCSRYNVVKFRWSSFEGDVDIAILFRREYLEVSVTSYSSNHACVYSTVKTACAEVLNRIRKEDITVLRYSFAVVCPRSGLKPHFIPFQGHSDLPNCKCIACKENAFSELEWENPRFWWVKTECNCSIFNTMLIYPRVE